MMGGSLEIIDREIIDSKLIRLKQGLDRSGRLLVALSAGVDSSCLLALVSRELGPEKLLAVTVASELHRAGEGEEAAALAARLDVEHRLLGMDLLAASEVAANGPDRCYVCKKMIFCELKTLASREGFNLIADGSNADDAGLHRPGMKALQELGIASPLMEAGLDKKEVRFLARELGLSCWNKPSEPCLATRFAVGHQLRPEELRRVEAAENYLRSLGVGGSLRVRFHGNLARIELENGAQDLVWEKRILVLRRFRELGFSHVTIDLTGFSSGSMD